ncbi:MAG: HEPN domain-containing protein [Elusimicrobiota bacterium]|nr:HEPN domain-containing protein [Endomicrobiia bacterium]MDW8166016.1 HEPN domain-containing protein [Elusimicrobiota bacterium]
MVQRSKDWLRQAERDLLHAKNAHKDKDYEWSCFAAQQASEKALKAVYEKNNKSVKGHSIVGLLEGLKKFKFPKEFYTYAKILSRYYIETRYPNGFPEGAPADYFDEKLSKEAIDAAEKILKWCRGIVSRKK